MSVLLTVSEVDIRQANPHNEDVQIDEAALYQKIGKRLRDRRRALGQPQEWLARRIGTTRTSITNIEAGSQRPPLHVLYALCRALGIEPTDLLPPIAEVLQTLSEEVTVSGTVRRVSPRAAQFIKSVAEEARRNEP